MNTLWFSWTAPEDGYLRVSAYANDWDLLLGLYHGDRISELSVSTNRYYRGAYKSFSGPAGLLAKVTGGVNYQLVVAAEIAQTGDFDSASDPAADVVLGLIFSRHTGGAQLSPLQNNWLLAEGLPDSGGLRVRLLRSQDLTNWVPFGISADWIEDWNGLLLPLGEHRNWPAEFFKGELVW